MIKNLLVSIAGLLLIVISGCSSVKTYTSTPEKNFSVIVKVEDKDVEAEIYVKGGLKNCETDPDGLLPALGRVHLQPGDTEIGLATEKLYLLVLYFNTKNFFGDEISNTSQRAIIIPKPGKKYRINMNYADKMYDVSLFERDANSSVWKRTPIVPYKNCK